MKKLLIFGAQGMVGSALVREAGNRPEYEVIPASRAEVDLTHREPVIEYVKSIKPDIVLVPAAKVGGIIANNSFPVEFLYENITIALNTVEAAYQAQVEMLLFLGSSCIYPKANRQPISEEDLMTGVLEPTNEPYAIAKIAGLKACEAYNRQHGTDFRGIMPTNLYGLNDNYHPNHSHVIPGLIRRMHESKISRSEQIEVWGSGVPLREFLYSDDLARACMDIIGLDRESYYSALPVGSSHVNIGAGEEVSIKDLSEKIARVIGLEAEIKFDLSKPDGAPRKALNSERMRSFGWAPEIMLDQGLELAYMDYLARWAN